MKSIIILAVLTYFATVFGTLRNIFVIQKSHTLSHLATGFESIVFAGTLVLVTKIPLQYYIPVYVIARQLAMWTSLYINDRINLGMVEVTVHQPLQEGKDLADALRAQGYSVITHKSYGFNGQEHLTLTISLPKKQLPELYSLVNEPCSNWSIRTIQKGAA